MALRKLADRSPCWISAEDIKFFEQYRWTWHKRTERIIRWEPIEETEAEREARLRKRGKKRRKKYRMVFLHRELLGMEQEDRYTFVLFKDENPRNCTRENLEIIQVGELVRRTAHPVRKSRTQTWGKGSKYLGVSVHKRTGRWQVHIRIDGKLKYLGSFPKTEQGELMAARKYNEYAAALGRPQNRIRQRRITPTKGSTHV